MKTTSDICDETLVIRSLGGDRDAFEEIVRRYQTLICSVAYSANGNVVQSEDIAQETFVTAWTKLAELREPARLKAWLCGIARNLAHNAHRREARRGTESLENLAPSSEPVSLEPLPDETAARGDEEALAWRALENVPEIYRETLVLYYRQHQSIEHVAVSLDVSEETVRQRLSRGRKALQDQVLALLGTTLTRTVPAVAFTSSVMSALPIATLPAAGSAAGIAGAASMAGGQGASSALAQGGAVSKAAALAALGAGGISALFGGIGLALGNRVSVELTETSRERAYVQQRSKRLWAWPIALFVGIAAIFGVWPQLTQPSVPALAITGMVFMAVWALTFFGYAHVTLRRQWQIRTEDAARGERVPARVPRYVSARHFLGLPLLAIDINGQTPVRAWIAIGHIAQGGLLAVGQYACAPIAVGACAIGLVSFGAIAMGGLSFGALAVSVWSAGAFAYGYDAMGGVAIAGHFAMGVVAWASQFAQGPHALAVHVNDAETLRALTVQPLFRYYALMPWAGMVIAMAAIVPNSLLLKRLKAR